MKEIVNFDSLDEGVKTSIVSTFKPNGGFIVISNGLELLGTEYGMPENESSTYMKIQQECMKELKELGTAHFKWYRGDSDGYSSSDYYMCSFEDGNYIFEIEVKDKDGHTKLNYYIYKDSLNIDNEITDSEVPSNVRSEMYDLLTMAEDTCNYYNNMLWQNKNTIMYEILSGKKLEFNYNDYTDELVSIRLLD